MADSDKPKVMVALGDTWPLGPDVMEAVKESPAVFSRSSDRMMRAIALYTRYGRLLARPSRAPRPSRSRACPSSARARSRNGSARKLLAAAGIRVPDGELARTVDEAVAVGQAHRLSGGAEGAGRGAVAQDRSRRRHARILPTKARCAPPGTR